IVPLLQLHDSLDCSVSSREQGERVARLGCAAVKLKVPMRVDLKFGRSWGDATHTWEELAGIAPPRAAEPIPARQSDANSVPEPEIVQQKRQTPPWVPDEETPMQLQNGKGEPVVNAPPIVPELGFSPTRDKPKKASETDQYSRSDWAP